MGVETNCKQSYLCLIDQENKGLAVSFEHHTICISTFRIIHYELFT